MTVILSQDEAAKLGLAPKPKRNKYNAKRVRRDGYGFDSLVEEKRYCELKLRERGGEIDGLVVHPRFDLAVNGKRIAVYEADFTYWDRIAKTGRVEDVKGKMTALSRQKIAHYEAQYGFKVEIIRK